MCRSSAALALLCLATMAGSSTLADEPTGDPRLVDLTGDWELLPDPLLWGFHNLYNAHVLQVDDGDYPYRMWLFGWASQEGNPGHPGYDAIFHARSPDMRHWEVWAGDGQWDATMTPERWEPVLSPGDTRYDNFHAGDPSVVRHEGLYHMAYSSVGVAEPPGQPGELQVISCIMGATSPDGIHWERSPAPILTWPETDRQSWLLEDGQIGAAPEGHMGSYHRPSLMRDGDRWRIWFDYFLPGTFVSMGLAECGGDFLDPRAWEVARAGDEPLLRDWPNTSVVKSDGTYMAFADPPGYPAEWGGDTRQLTMAVSPDGVSWRVVGHILPLPGDSTHVPQAAALEVDGQAWLYLLCAWKPPSDPWDYRYKRIRALRRPLADVGLGR